MRSALLQPTASDPPFEAFSITARPTRVAICPPQAARSRAWLATLRDWFGGSGWQRDAGASHAARPDPARRGALPLDAIRQEFIDAIDGIRTPGGDDLLDRIHFARCLRELWHLRAEVFRLVSLHHSQAEADERLNTLNRHFPTRSPRSGFGPLNPLTNPLTTKDMWP